MIVVLSLSKISLSDPDVADLKEYIKKKLSPKLDDVSLDEIYLRKHNSDDNLLESTPITELVNNMTTSLRVVVLPAGEQTKRLKEFKGKFWSFAQNVYYNILAT